jgi:hypothetical protein
MVDDQLRKISRSSLYDEIWEIAVTGVSKKYGIPYSKLLKICKKYQIPVPYSGYWTKISFGKPVEKFPLPQADDFEIDLVNDYLTGRKVKDKPIAKPPIDRKLTAGDKTSDSEAERKTENNELLEEKQVPKTPYKLVHGVNNIYQREKLYEEIWSKPVVDVAEQYGVSDVTIVKVCKSLEVPVPPRGYWAKIRSGDIIPRPSLKPTKGKTVKVGPKTHEGQKPTQVHIKFERLAFLEEDEKKAVLDAAEQISLSDANRPFHKNIISYRSTIKQWNKDDRKPDGSSKNPRSYSNSPPFLAGVISEDTLPRVFRLLDTLFRQIESMGGSINSNLTLNIRNELVSLSIYEEQDQVLHVMTKKEARDLLIYEDAKKHHSWASQPQIRKYDYVFNGRLVIEIRRGRYFRDKDSVKIESRLGEMLVDLYEESEVVRSERVEREEAVRKRKEEDRLKEERRQRYNQEVERTIALENEASDFAIACRIRSYVRAVEEGIDPSEMNEKTRTWIEWASKKADWYDPTVARDDEIFGVREHEKNADQKSLRSSRYYW